jgi:hypothetical protein
VHAALCVDARQRAAFVGLQDLAQWDTTHSRRIAHVETSKKLRPRGFPATTILIKNDFFDHFLLT